LHPGIHCFACVERSLSRSSGSQRNLCQLCGTNPLPAYQMCSHNYSAHTVSSNFMLVCEMCLQNSPANVVLAHQMCSHNCLARTFSSNFMLTPAVLVGSANFRVFCTNVRPWVKRRTPSLHITTRLLDPQHHHRVLFAFQTHRTV
jgi:hypothetical protein